jgi:RimJ/RimL family protein N-acetyltransferase
MERTIETQLSEPEELVVVAGRCVVVRPLVQGDVPALTRFYEEMDDDTRYRRFLQAMPRLPAGLVAAIASPVNQLTLAIDLGDEHRGSVLAEVVFSPSRQDPTRGEIAYTVHSSLRRQGLATRALRHALRRAHHDGVRHVDAYIGAENRPSILLMHSLGARTSFEGGLVVAALDLPVPEPPPPVRVVSLPCLDLVAERTGT